MSEELASSTPKRQRCAEQPTPENADCKKAELISIGVAFVQSMDERLEVIPRHCARGVGLHFKQLAQEVARAARLASVGPRRRGTTLVRVKRRAKEAEGRKPVFSEELRSDLAHGCRDGRVQALRANDNMLRRTMTVQDAHIGSHIRNKQACAAPCRRLRTHHPRCGIGAF